MPPPPSSSPLKIGLKPPLGTPRKLKFGIKCYFNPTKRNMKKNITPPPSNPIYIRVNPPCCNVAWSDFLVVQEMREGLSLTPSPFRGKFHYFY